MLSKKNTHSLNSSIYRQFVTVDNALKTRFHFVSGAVAGCGYLHLVAPSKWINTSSLGMTKLNSEMGVFQGVGVEVVATMLLVLLVLVISDHDPEKDFEVRCCYYNNFTSHTLLNRTVFQARVFWIAITNFVEFN